MSVSISLLGQASQTSGATSIGTSVTVPAGGAYLDVYVTAGVTVTTGFTGVSDNSGNSNTYTQQSAVIDTVDSQGLAHYTCTLAAAGTFTVTASFSATVGDIAIAVFAVTGSTGLIASCAANYQASPGTGTAGVTTGASGALSTAASTLVGLTITSSGTASITAAGGSSQLGSTIWTNIKANFAFVETQSLTATTSVSATFTSANGNPQVSAGGVWGSPIVAATAIPLGGSPRFQMHYR